MGAIFVRFVLGRTEETFGILRTLSNVGLIERKSNVLLGGPVVPVVRVSCGVRSVSDNDGDHTRPRGGHGWVDVRSILV